MESDMMQPIDDSTYNENVYEQIQDQQAHGHPHGQPSFHGPVHESFYQSLPPAPSQSKDFLSSIDKNTWILILVAFIIGFFMGKTMQPVIIRGV